MTEPETLEAQNTRLRKELEEERSIRSAVEGLPTMFEVVWAKIIDLDDSLLPGWRDSNILYWSNALAGEAGEVCNATKKMLGGGTKGDSAPLARVNEEMVDTFTYLVLYWTRLGGTPQEFLRHVMAKNAENWRRMNARGNVEVNWK